MSTASVKNQIVDAPDSFAQADLKLLESRGFFFRVDAHGVQRRDHVLNFVTVLFEGVKGSDFVLLQLLLGEVDLIVTQFYQRPRFTHRIGLMLVFRQILGQTVLRGEWGAERQRRNQADPNFRRHLHLGRKKNAVIHFYFFLDCPSSFCRTGMRWRA